MLDALDARDGPALRLILQMHLQHKRDAVLELMRAGALQQVLA
jgi:DNA-binding GntR family transcriptional regulator